jgi:hypothetical protein
MPPRDSVSRAADTGGDLAPPRFHRGRRRFLIGAAATGAAALALGQSWPDDGDAQAEYQALVDATWRHGNDSPLPWPSAQREIVRYATLAANNLNSQPWRFQLLARRIAVLPAFDSQDTAGDLDGHELALSLGCATENLVQAAAAFGLAAVAAFDPATGGVRIELETRRAERSPLFEAIPHRHSARTLYDGRAVGTAELRRLAAVGTGPGVDLLLVTAAPQLDAFRSAAVTAIRVLADDPSYVRELRSAVRFKYRDALNTRDGLFLKSYGEWSVPDPVARMLFGMSLSPNSMSLLPDPMARVLSGRAFAGAIVSRTLDRQIRSSAGIAVFSSERSDPAHWIEAGRCCQRFTLQAAALGIRTAYVSKPANVPSVRGELAADLGMPGRRLDAAIRFGYGPELPPSLRRPVDQVIIPA